MENRKTEGGPGGPDTPWIRYGVPDDLQSQTGEKYRIKGIIGVCHKGKRNPYRTGGSRIHHRQVDPGNAFFTQLDKVQGTVVHLLVFQMVVVAVGRLPG